MTYFQRFLVNAFPLILFFLMCMVSAFTGYEFICGVWGLYAMLSIIYWYEMN